MPTVPATISDVRAELIRRGLAYQHIANIVNQRHHTHTSRTMVRNTLLTYWNRPDLSPSAGTISAHILAVIEEAINTPTTYEVIHARPSRAPQPSTDEWRTLC